MSPNRLGTNKDLEALARRARKSGWTVEVASNNHILWTPPEGRPLRTGLTMNKAGVSQAIRKLKKAGLG